MYESYHFDLLSKYSDYLNPDFEIINIESMNNYSKDKA